MSTRQSETIEDWFKKSATRPIYYCTMFVAVFLLAFVILYCRTKYDSLSLQLQNLTTVVNLSLRQNNRVLAESFIEATRRATNSQGIALCKQNEVQVSSNIGTGCERKSGLYLSISKPISGFDGHSIVAHFWYINLFALPIFIIVVAVIGSVLIFLRLRHLKNQIRLDILSPLQNFYSKNSSPKIEELRLIKERIETAMKSEVELLLNKEISDIASRLAHDIRSPLSTINLAIGSIDNLDESIRMLVGSASNRINHIANEMLTLRKQKINRDTLLGFKTEFKGKKNSSMHVKDVKIGLENLLSEKRLEFSRTKNIEFSLSCNNLKDCRLIKIDKFEFERSMSNLLNNAIESINKKNGKIDILFSYEEPVHVLSESLGNGKYIISISDNGLGFEEGSIQRIFSDFDKKVEIVSQKGNGIGLSSSISIFRKFGGDLSIFSKQNEGSTISVTLQEA